MYELEDYYNSLNSMKIIEGYSQQIKEQADFLHDIVLVADTPNNTKEVVNYYYLEKPKF